MTWGCCLSYIMFANAAAQQGGCRVIKHWGLSLCSANASYFRFSSCSSQRDCQLHHEEPKGLSGGQKWCSQQGWSRDHTDAQGHSLTHIISFSSWAHPSDQNALFGHHWQMTFLCPTLLSAFEARLKRLFSPTSTSQSVCSQHCTVLWNRAQICM